jgi:hypothetical protein
VVVYRPVYCDFLQRVCVSQKHFFCSVAVAEFMAGENGIMRSFEICTPVIIRLIETRKIKLEWHVACMGEMKNAYKILVCEPEGK